MKQRSIGRGRPGSVLLGAVLVLFALSSCDDLIGAAQTLDATAEEARTLLVDPESVPWAALRNMSEATLSSRNAAMRNRGWMMVDIGFDETASGQNGYYAVWHENNWHVDLPGERRWQAHWDLSLAELQQKQTDLDELGYRLVNQQSYLKHGQRYWAGIWYENREAVQWVAFQDVNSMQYAINYQQYEAQGFMPVDFVAYSTDSGVRYAAIWVENTENYSWRHKYYISAEEMQEKMGEIARMQMRPIALSSFMESGSHAFGAIWVRNRPRKPFQGAQEVPPFSGFHRHSWDVDLTAQEYAHRIRLRSDLGFRPVRLTIYPTEDGPRVAALWRQNAMRDQWIRRAAANELLSAHMTDNELPSISAAVIKDGVVLYRRGFGYRDVEQQLPADSRTRYRLASVSKPIAGIIGMRLQEQGVLDLEDPTSEYLEIQYNGGPGLGAKHTHTLAQLLAHLGCIPHYESSNVPSFSLGQYNTALQAAAEFDFWNADLLDDCEPGQNHHYSTPAYTLLGAAFEEAVGGGTSVADLVRQELNEPFGLSSLRAEDRDEPDVHRAMIYDDSFEPPEAEAVQAAFVSGGEDVIPLDADNLSWKVLGGGLEAHAYDMARLGRLLLDDAVLEPESRDQMWTVVDPDLPDEQAQERALGWRSTTVTHNGVEHEVRRHTGNQTGGNSSWRIYPEENLVVVVLSNRRGAATDTAARGLARLALSAP